MKSGDTLPYYEKLQRKIYAYFQTIWKEKWKEDIHQDWILNFDEPDEDLGKRERLNMMYLLSKFMYFGNEEIRELLYSLFRDLIKYPIVANFRRNNLNTVDPAAIKNAFEFDLKSTRFLGVGNPSESGVHMLYFFRQECDLPKSYFMNTSEIFATSRTSVVLADGSTKTSLETNLRDSTIKRYIFIDDFCGSGSQASKYLSTLVENIKFKDPSIEVSYLMLFGTNEGIDVVRKLKVFDRVEAVFTIDETFKAFSVASRYFKEPLPDSEIDKTFSMDTALKYGTRLFGKPLGYGDCQLLLGFHHNTPDNSLPIFWAERNGWKPIFRRYNKIY